MTKITAMPGPLLERAEEVEDLRLHGDVECGRGLVGDEQARFAREREREQGALAHAARQLVRVVAEAPLGVGDADELEQLLRALAGCALAHRAVQADRVDELRADGERGVQAGHRVLEDHRDLVAAHLAHLVERERQQVAPVEHHRAAGDAPRRRRAPVASPPATTRSCRNRTRRRGRPSRPASTSKLTWSTTVAGPASVRNSTDRSVTDSSRSDAGGGAWSARAGDGGETEATLDVLLALGQPETERVADAVAEGVEGEDRDHQRKARDVHLPRVFAEVQAAVLDHRAPARRRALHAETEQAQLGLGDQREPDRERHRDDQG